MPTLLSLALLAPANGPAAVVPDAAPAEAFRLDGRRGLFLVTPNSDPDEHGGMTVCECEAPAGIVATLWLRPGERPPDGATILEARLHVVRHRARVIGGVRFEGFTEYRLLDALPVGPHFPRGK